MANRSGNLTSNVAIMQPYFFPYLGYFQLIHSADKFVFYDNLEYIKNGWVNRNRLLQVNKAPFYITVPIPKKNRSSRKICDVKILEGNWRRKILNSIYLNYKRSNFFSEVFPMIEQIFQMSTDSLSDFNIKSIMQVTKFLGIDTTFVHGSQFAQIENLLLSTEVDHLSDTLGVEMSCPTVKLARGIVICKQLNAKRFINPIGGSQMYPRLDFISNDLDAAFLLMRNIKYKQNSPTFFPSLSIIDVLMNNGKTETVRLLDEYDLY